MNLTLNNGSKLHFLNTKDPDPIKQQMWIIQIYYKATENTESFPLYRRSNKMEKTQIKKVA
jgi:hypothetical protein